MTVWKWPNSSKEIIPKSCVQGDDRAHHDLVRGVRERQIGHPTRLDQHRGVEGWQVGEAGRLAQRAVRVASSTIRASTSVTRLAGPIVASGAR